MTQQRTGVRLSEDLLALLDEHAVRRGVSRSELIRQALEDYVSSGRAAVDTEIVEGYRRIPPPERDPWAESAARRSIAEEPW